jgi:hypothetical protein
MLDLEKLREMLESLQEDIYQRDLTPDTIEDRLEDIIRYTYVLEDYDPNSAVTDEDVDEMCPNCVTPWKCNGPHWGPEDGPETLVFDDEPNSDEGED